MCELLALDELAGYPDDEPDRITETDVFDAERDIYCAEDELSFAEQVDECCGGVEPGCDVHYSHPGPPRGFYTYPDY